MDLYFLEADQPITKRYSLDANGTLVKHPYPFVYNVTSFQESIGNLTDFHTALLKHSSKGRTLVKGALGRPLIQESRAGTTDPDLRTSWICLDLDGVEGFQTVDLFLQAIGAGDVSYVLQWSSSMGIENASGFRCHIFMFLHQETHPQVLKHWLQHLNLTIPELKPQLALTKTANSLRWPLDITTCQNDKLLYIAPPRFDKGLSDPYPGGARISLEPRPRPTLILPATLPTREALRGQMHQAINDLRVAQGLVKRRTTQFKYSGTTEYMTKPDSAIITGQKTERGFVYFNLNNGDSWAYYHPENNPTFIHNFKGEPSYRTEDLLPEYWAKLQSQANTYQPTSSGAIYLAFRDFSSGAYYNGIYDVPGDDLRLAMAKSESQLRHFMKQHGQPLGDFIVDWDMVFEPDNPVVVDADARILNVYRPSQYFKVAQPAPVPQIPPVIHKILHHVLGDLPTIDHFVNWLAVIAQTYDRTCTAWVLHGTQGTGKGLLFHSVLSPLFGAWNTEAKRMEEIESDFTGFLKNKFILFIDEVEAGKSLYHSKITAKLKNLIVEPQISIREMYKPAYMARNRVNMIFASNKNAPVEVEPDDRRFNVAIRQEIPLNISPSEVDAIEGELPEFYAYLKNYPIDVIRARTPLINASRTQLIETGRLAIDVLSDSLLRGDLQALWEYLPDRKPVGMELDFKRQGLYERFRQLIVEAVQGETKLSRDDLYTVFQWCVGSMPESPNKFTSLIKHHKIHLGVIWKNGRSVRGINVNWVYDANWHVGAAAEIQNGSV